MSCFNVGEGAETVVYGRWGCGRHQGEIAPQQDRDQARVVAEDRVKIFDGLHFDLGFHLESFVASHRCWLLADPVIGMSSIQVRAIDSE